MFIEEVGNYKPKMSGEWTVIESVMEGTEEAITDIILLTKKEKAPPGYHVIDFTADGKKADFAEGMFTSTRRYLAYSRAVPSARGRLALVDIRVASTSERPQLNFLPLAHTHDDNTKAFSQKVLTVKVAPHEQTKRAVTELQILSANRKEDVPTGFTRLADINGFSICYKMGNVGRRNSEPKTQQLAPGKAKGVPVRQPSLAKNVRSATDGLQFKLSETVDKKQYLVKHAIGDLMMLSLDDFEDKYTVDFAKFRSLANIT